MSASTIIAQSINILAQPILTRIISPEVLGIYTFIISIANIVIPVASLKMDMLVVTEKEEDEAQYITDTCIFVNFVISLASLLLISICYILGNNVFSKYGIIIFVVPFIIFTNGIRFLFISYNNRYRQYKLIGVVGIIRETSRAIIQILFGLLGFGVLGQTMGYAFAPLFGLKKQTNNYIKYLRNRSFITYKKMLQVIRNGRNQILYLVPAQFINSLSSSLIIIYITSLYSPDSLGYYSAGVRLLEIPMIFIAANVSKVCYKQIGEDVANSHLVLKTFVRISLVICLVSVLGFGLLYIIAPDFSRFVFGAGYETTGYYIRCLCIMYAVRLISTSFSGLFTIFGMQSIELYMTSFVAIVSFVIYFVCKGFNYSMIDFLWLISISYTIMYGFIWLGYYYLCRNYDKKAM